MSEIYNPNPTILKTAGKRGIRASSSLWDLGEEMMDGSRLYDGHPVRESIDQDEIFGQHTHNPSLRPAKATSFRSGQVHHRPGAQTHVIGGIDGRLCPPVQYFEWHEQGINRIYPDCSALWDEHGNRCVEFHSGGRERVTLVGLTLRVRLLRALPDRFKVDIRVKPGSHQSENECMYTGTMQRQTINSNPIVNKQLNDKERVAAALENPALLTVLEECLQQAQNSVRGRGHK